MSCSVCGEQGHSMTKCPTLIAPLQPGFFTGGPSGGGEEDSAEKIGAAYACSGDGVFLCRLRDRTAGDRYQFHFHFLNLNKVV